MDCIDSIIDTFVHRLNSSRYIHLSLQPLCIIFADQLFQLLYQRVGLLLCDEFGRLDGIYQTLNSSKLEWPVDYAVMIAIADWFTLYFNSGYRQILADLRKLFCDLRSLRIFPVLP